MKNNSVSYFFLIQKIILGDYFTKTNILLYKMTFSNYFDKFWANHIFILRVHDHEHIHTVKC